MYVIGRNDRPHEALLSDFGKVVKFASDKVGGFESYSPGASLDDDSPIDSEDDLADLELPDVPIAAGEDPPIETLEVEHYFWCRGHGAILYVETRTDYWVLELVFGTRQMNDSLTEQYLLEFWEVSQQLNPVCAIAGEETEIYTDEKKILFENVSPFATSLTFEFCILTAGFEQPPSSRIVESKSVTNGKLFRTYYLFEDWYGS